MHRLALILLASGACVANGGDEGFNIVHNLAPPDDECLLTPGGAFLGSGKIEATALEGYILTPEISSRITSPEGTEAQRTITLRGARTEVEVVSPAGQTLANNKFTTLFSASLPPGGAAATAFEIVPPSILSQLNVTGTARVVVVAKVTPFGVLGDNSEIDGVEFQYPVTVCDQCVAAVLGPCPLPAGTFVANSPNSCNPFQDGAVTCCSQGANLPPLCPATVAP